MNKQISPIGGIFTNAVALILKQVFKVSIITLAFGFKFTGLFLSRIGETLESVIIKIHR